VQAVAQQCGDWLLANAVPAGPGIGWPIVLPASGPLTGFSHGAAGGAWALLELAALTGDEKYSSAARAAIAYERSLFSAQAENWPDLRDSDDPSAEQEPSFVTAWCHGAPGIGLARLSSLRHFDDPVARREAEAAVRTTLKHGFGGNHSLCHGDLGNLELLLQAREVLDQPQYQADIDRLAAQILDEIRLRGWISGVPQGAESPGLMTGLAGIGYGLLRLAAPQHVPSLLTLEPPRQADDHVR
jgi:lantibiotic modifying enzyme